MDRLTLILEASQEFPCPWTDLDEVSTNRIYAAVYTLEDVKKDPPGRLITSPGITKAKGDGIWDIFIDVPELDVDIVRSALKDLSKITNKEYYLL